MDKIKEQIASHVQRVILDTNWNAIVSPEGELVNGSQVVSPLMTRIRIPSQHAGPRYFDVIVKETY